MLQRPMRVREGQLLSLVALISSFYTVEVDADVTGSKRFNWGSALGAHHAPRVDPSRRSFSSLSTDSDSEDDHCSYYYGHVSKREFFTSKSTRKSLVLLRGGAISTRSTSAQDDDDEDDLENDPNDNKEEERLRIQKQQEQQQQQQEYRAYLLRQQLYLQSRSLQLRQAIIDRGLQALAHTTGPDDDNDNNNKRKRWVDWDCALATAASPKSCLYSFDAELGTKVVAPVDTQQWITLTALNRLRRLDPTKVEPLWHDQYAILSNWFRPLSSSSSSSISSLPSTSSPSSLSSYSWYQHLTPRAALVSFLLDTPGLLAAIMSVALLSGVVLTAPVWEYVAHVVLRHALLWSNWHHWGRFVHAALPLKLLLAQLAWKGLATVLQQMHSQLRQQLVEYECQLYEQALPLTILEGLGDDDDDDDVVGKNERTDLAKSQKWHDHEAEGEAEDMLQVLDEDEEDE